MTEFRQLATDALYEIGVLGVGDVFQAADAEYCKRVINRMLDEWQVHTLLLYAQNMVTWDIVPSQTSYTVGTSANINTPRPTYIDAVSWIDTTQSPDLEVQVPGLTDQMWASISLKGQTANLPTCYYYNPTYGATGFGTLYFWPIPTQADLDGRIYTRYQVAQIASLDTDVLLPNGWLHMIVTNLAVALAPGFSRTPSDTLVRKARESMAAVKRSNVRGVELVSDSGALIQTGGGGAWDHSRFLAGG